MSGPLSHRALYVFLACMLSLVVCPVPAQAALRFHWKSDFTAPERHKLRDWLQRSYAGLESLVGSLPFDVDVYLIRRDQAGEPVPWAHTRRGPSQGIDFYVDPEFPARAFHEDWTAPHELSHLVLPWLGSRNSWFAEGFASFMQIQVMAAMGVLDTEQAGRRYRDHLQRAGEDYPYPRLTFVEAAPRLRKQHRFPVMYWGGSVYFLRVDRALRQAGRDGLARQLRRFVACCRSDDASLDGLAATLDRASGSSVFSETLQQFARERGFPAYQAWLPLPVSRAASP